MCLVNFNMALLKICLRFWMLCLIIQGAWCLRDVQLIVPEAAQRGSKVVMKCLYTLENEVLYSVKWYRGEKEFCRYSPRDVPPLKIFQITGIDVVRGQTDDKQLTIAHATKYMYGKFTCEVSADEPSFQTSVVHSLLKIVDLPASGPEVYGVKYRYKPGMKLKAECVIQNSLPPANLSFFINSEPAPPHHVWQRVEIGANNLMTAYSTISFVVQKHHFIDDRLKIRCTAFIYSIYVQSTEKSAMREKDKPKPVDPEVTIYRPTSSSIHRVPTSNGCSSIYSRPRSKMVLLAIILFIRLTNLL